MFTNSVCLSIKTKICLLFTYNNKKRWDRHIADMQPTVIYAMHAYVLYIYWHVYKASLYCNLLYWVLAQFALRQDGFL